MLTVHGSCQGGTFRFVDSVLARQNETTKDGSHDHNHNGAVDDRGVSNQEDEDGYVVVLEKKEDGNVYRDKNALKDGVMAMNQSFSTLKVV